MPNLDIRELILTRIQAVVAREPISAVTVVRNRGLLGQEARPAVAIMDGDETANRQSVSAREGTSRMRPAIVTMQPEIYILPKTKLPQNESIGNDVNSMRIAIVEALASDDELQVLCTSITYLGMTTDFKSGMSMQGQARLNIAFVYALDPY